MQAFGYTIMEDKREKKIRGNPGKSGENLGKALRKAACLCLQDICKNHIMNRKGTQKPTGFLRNNVLESQKMVQEIQHEKLCSRR